MSSIIASTNFTQVKSADLAEYVEKFASDVVDKVNGKLDFATNINCKTVSVTFASAGTDFAVQHGLGRLVTNYIVTSLTAGMVIYNGLKANSSSILYLQSTAPGTATLIVF